jgi:CPA1 family monovalent cation:H+ antiporter
MSEEHTFNLVLLVTTLLFISSAVAATSKRLKFPYTIVLVIIGLAMGVLGTKLHFMEQLFMFRLSPEVVVFVFCPY